MKHASTAIIAITTAVMAGCSSVPDTADDAIYSCETYTVYDDSVVEGEYVAHAVSRFEIESNLPDAPTAEIPAAFKFRFLLNGRDNEFRDRQFHLAQIYPGEQDTTIYSFGKLTSHEKDDSRPDGDTLPANTVWTVRVDMKPMLKSFERRGYYVTPSRDTIFADDFRNVSIIGSAPPLPDYIDTGGNRQWTLKDRGDSVYQLTLRLNPRHGMEKSKSWRIDSINPRFPSYESGHTLVDAIYNMSIDRLSSTLDGTHHDKFTTRDISLAVWASLATLDAEWSMDLLRSCTKNGRLRRDNGYGGGWPVVSDRIIWAMAAWEVYNVTADREWLREASDIISRSLDEDMDVMWDSRFNLMHGSASGFEPTSLTYPRWMQPADVYSSMNLTVNAAYSRAYYIASCMHYELGDNGDRYKNLSDSIRNSINDLLWIPNRGYYSQYLYGGVYPIQSQASDYMGQAICVLSDITTTEMAQSLIGLSPVVKYGVPSMFPFPDNEISGGNGVVSPTVQAFWNLAAAKTGNYEALKAGLGAMFRTSALLTDIRPIDAVSGFPLTGTSRDASRLSDYAGNIAMYLRVFAGMSFDSDGITFRPIVLPRLHGNKTIKNIKYRDATVSVTVRGTGDKVASMTMDGKPVKGNLIYAENLSAGEHNIEITMANNTLRHSDMTMSDAITMPPTPLVEWNTSRQARITNPSPGIGYEILLNGVVQEETDETTYELFRSPSFTTVGIVPIKDSRWAGFSPRPFMWIPRGSVIIVQAEDVVDGGTTLIKDEDIANGVVETSTTSNTSIAFRIGVPEDGTYFLDVRYSNGNGSLYHGDKCAIRSLVINGERVGSIVMPQRGDREWRSTGFSNALSISLKKGVNTVEIAYLHKYDTNMNRKTNTALIDYIRFIRQ